MELYKTLVKPQLESCVLFCLEHYRKDVIAPERVQRRFTRMLPGWSTSAMKRSWLG